MNFTEKWAERDWQRKTAIDYINQNKNDIFHSGGQIPPDLHLARSAARKTGASVADILKWIAEK